ncbi:hypothetical protein ACFYWX_40430 [Streptomyces sp. NPDC002888]|uniref:hypothetical protein n=1 Tax=Streptomyces sp. NPDC002888 TaxID=3364668 RepID=UPI0036814002
MQLPDATAMDGELVVWDAAGRLTFERLQNRPRAVSGLCHDVFTARSGLVTDVRADA